MGFMCSPGFVLDFNCQMELHATPLVVVVNLESAARTARHRLFYNFTAVLSSADGANGIFCSRDHESTGAECNGIDILAESHTPPLAFKQLELLRRFDVTRERVVRVFALDDVLVGDTGELPEYAATHLDGGILEAWPQEDRAERRRVEPLRQHHHVDEQLGFASFELIQLGIAVGIASDDIAGVKPEVAEALLEFGALFVGVPEHQRLPPDMLPLHKCAGNFLRGEMVDRVVMVLG